MNVLDLSGADTSGFEPIPSGKYNVRVGKVDLVETGPNSQVPGTPMLKVQLKVTEGEHEGSTVFDQFTLPNPSDGRYDPAKAQKTLGFFVRFLTAMGYDEEKVKKGGFKLEAIDDLIGREAVATVRFVAPVMDPDSGGEKYAAKNEVAGYRVAGSETAPSLV